MPLSGEEAAAFAILESAPAGVLVLDECFELLYANTRAPGILGVTRPRLGEAAQALLNGPLLAHGLDGGEMVVAHTRPDGEERTLRLLLDSLPFGPGDATVLWLYDETELRRAYIEAEQAAHARSQFLATMSHEIRTPMGGIATIADLLHGTPLDAEQRRMVQTIRGSADALLTIIDDVLDFSKIEAGRLEVEEHPFEPSAVGSAVAALLRPKAKEKGLRLTAVTLEEVPAWVLGDGHRVRQVLLNLVGNAIKFTERGGVTVRLSCPAPERLRVEVVDTGIGIGGEERMRLFSPFVQADASIARRFGGSGLGLSICQGLVRLMGGDIGVDSTPGVGSLFWFEIPAPPCAAPRPAEASESGAEPEPAPAAGWAVPGRAAAEQARAVVLCVDDNATNRYVLERVLTRLGIVHDIAEDASQALSMLRFDVHGLLLTDLHMPELDGYGLTRRVRAAESAAGRAERLPILALTADGMRGVAERCLEAGLDGHLVKPIRMEELDAVLCRHLPAAARLRVPADAAPEPAVPESAMPEPAAPDPAAPEGEVLDLSLLRNLIGDDPAELQGALEEFCLTAADLVQAIDEASGAEAAGSDPERSARRRDAAHTLKSASRCIGANALADQAAALEAAELEGDAERAAELAPAIRGLFEGVERSVRRMAQR